MSAPLLLRCTATDLLTKPGELSIYLESKFELLVNTKTAKALGVTIPTSLVLRADEIVE
jgi:putative ABC transport system substrate-binding protein